MAPGATLEPLQLQTTGKMTAGRFGKPSDRSSRRQVVAYLPSDEADRIRSRAAAAGETIQETIAKAVNSRLATFGIGPVLNELKLSHFVRKQQAAAVRPVDGHTAARQGTKILAGWFDRQEVLAFGAVCAELGLPAQVIIVEGLAALTVQVTSEAVGG